MYSSELFRGIPVAQLLRIKEKRGYGVSIAVAQGSCVDTYCAGSGRFGQDFSVNPDMLFQAGSVSKSMFALTLLRYVDRGILNLDMDLSHVLSDFVDFPLTFPALLSHTAGFNVPGFLGYRAGHRELSLEEVLSGKGNSPKVRRTLPYGAQHRYSGGGITLAELAFTRLTGVTLREAFQKEVAEPLHLTHSGFFQPLDEDKRANAAFGGMLGIWKDRERGYQYHPEHAAAGFWTTPTELAQIGVALAGSVREDGLLRKESAVRMMSPVRDNAGLCIFLDGTVPDLAGHNGQNVGFLTMWGFSLKEDLSVAVMTNRSKRSISRNLGEVGKTLFLDARMQMREITR